MNADKGRTTEEIIVSLDSPDTNFIKVLSTDVMCNEKKIINTTAPIGQDSLDNYHDQGPFWKDKGTLFTDSNKLTTHFVMVLSTPYPVRDYSKEVLYEAPVQLEKDWKQTTDRFKSKPKKEVKGLMNSLIKNIY